MSRRKKYHEGNTVLWTSSLRFQIRSNTLNLTFITLFSTIIILLTCFVSINYKVQFEAVGRNLPNDIAFQSLNQQTNDKIDSLIKSSGHAIQFHRTLELLEAEPVSDMGVAFENPEYYTPYVLLISEHDYNEFIALRGDEQTVALQKDEAVTLAQGTDFPMPLQAGNQPSFQVKVEAEHKFTLVEKKDFALLGWATDPLKSMSIKPAVLVISDDAYTSLRSDAASRTYEIYQIDDAKNAGLLSKQVHELVSAGPGAYYSSFADVYARQIEGSSLLLFSSAFLALIALFALASVIYFKQLREAADEQQQYAILRKIGVEDGQMKSVIRKQLLFVFSPPLVLGILNSWFIIKTYILDSVRDFPQSNQYGLGYYDHLLLDLLLILPLFHESLL